MSEEQQNEVTIQDLQLNLQVYQIQSEQKLAKLENLFKQKKSVDLTKMFYQQRSALQIKFQNIIGDLTQFLINQEIASTDKLRKTFFKILQNPLTFLFKVSRYEIFNLRLNAFDIQLEPIDAIIELGNQIISNIKKHQILSSKKIQKFNGGEYNSFDSFLEDSLIRLIQDQIYLLYNYLRKGVNLIKKKNQDKMKIVDLYNQIQQKLLKKLIQNRDAKTLKQISLLNYQIYLLDNQYSVLNFYIKIPFIQVFTDVFKQLEQIGLKAKEKGNFDIFIFTFLKYSKEILNKIEMQGIDESFIKYIQTILITLIQLWNCRLCGYQQFLDLFTKLLIKHPNRGQMIQKCINHAPSLQNQDVILLKMNYKLEQKINTQFISVLHQKSTEQINKTLNATYHRLTYNLDFKKHKKQQIFTLLNLLNGNTSLNQFFIVIQKCLKDWNFSIDLRNSLKYLDSQFKMPKYQKSLLLQNIRLITNFCLLQSNTANEYEQIVKIGTIQKSLFGLSLFLLSNEKGMVFSKQNIMVQQMIVQILQFLARTVINKSQWQEICENLSSHVQVLSNEESIKKMINLIQKMIIENYEQFLIENMVKIFQNILRVQIKLKYQLQINNTLDLLVNLFFNQTKKQNNHIHNFKLFNININKQIKISKNQQEFIKKYAQLNNNIIEPRQLGCFVLSDLELITNPVQFQKAIDNYYFQLQYNSRRFVQYLCNLIINSAQKQLLLRIFQNLIKNYPISIPSICFTRINVNNQSLRFIQWLIKEQVHSGFNIIKNILQCRMIRYRNGRDFMTQQVTPIVLKQCIKKVNEKTKDLQYYQLLSLSISLSKITQLKSDQIQKAIQSINYQIAQRKQQIQIYRLIQSQYQVVSKYFQKKQNDFKKNGFKDIHAKIVWKTIRTLASPLQTQNIKPKVNKSLISQQIILTPYSATPIFDNQPAKLQKVFNLNQEKKQIQDLPLSNLKNLLPIKSNQNVISQNNKLQTKYIQVDLNSLKYSLETHLGQQFTGLCMKNGIKIITKSTKQTKQVIDTEQDHTLVQYYMKEFMLPEIQYNILIQYLKAVLDNKIKLSFIYSNHANLQKIFITLILLLGFLFKNQKYSSNTTLIDKLLNIKQQEKLILKKTILKLLGQIGYHNIWSENYNSIKNISYLKQLRQKSLFKPADAEDETFLSWILKNCLQNTQLKQELNDLLGGIFSTRPSQQTSLMYKVSINKYLLNLIMKSLQIQNLKYISLLFHANYNNLRLYTDQLHQGLKSLNMNSKNRAYNEFIQLSKDIEDQQFLLPMKLFKQNFDFFIRIQKQGYRFKKQQQVRLTQERIINLLRNQQTKEKLLGQIQSIFYQYLEQIQKIQLNIASRVKALYLSTKLRDFSHQNAITISLVHDILRQKLLSQDQIINKIDQIQIFTLLNKLADQLVNFDFSIDNFIIQDRYTSDRQTNICSTRRYSHSISKIYQKCEIQLDEVIQRCIEELKYFFTTSIGKLWMKKAKIYPPFLAKSFINYTISTQQSKTIKNTILQSIKNCKQFKNIVSNQISDILKSLKILKKQILLGRQKVKIQYNNRSYGLSEFLIPLKELMINSQTFVKSKEGHLSFNKYKSSQKTLQQIQLLGFIIGFSILHNIQIDLNLHSSLLAAIGFGISELDDLLDIDFKIWQDLRNVLSAVDVKQLNISFSYIFQSLKTLQPQRVELTNQGISKKVNNMNKDQYCDLVCCHVLYKDTERQTTRLLQGILYCCPKTYIASLKLSDLYRLLLNKQPKYLNQILKRTTKKRGLVLQSYLWKGGNRVQNTKDYQTIQWINELFDQNPTWHQKLWPLQQNLFLVTWIGRGVEFDSNSRLLLIGNINSKQQLKQALIKFV